MAELFEPDTNIAISPYTVWSLLAIATEGARGNTLRQLEQSLNIPAPEERKGVFRSSYRSLHKYLSVNAIKDYFFA